MCVNVLVRISGDKHMIDVIVAFVYTIQCTHLMKIKKRNSISTK